MVIYSRIDAFRQTLHQYILHRFSQINQTAQVFVWERQLHQQVPTNDMLRLMWITTYTHYTYT